MKDDETIWVKASGNDMATLGPRGLAPLNRQKLFEMFSRSTMTDTEMMEGYREALLDSGFPAPSIETLLHNYLPQSFVLHTHADAIVTLTNTLEGTSLAERVIGDLVPVLPYVFPGFPLAQFVANHLRVDELGNGFALAHHGLFTMSDSAQQAYNFHRTVVERAESFILAETGIRFVDDDDQRRLRIDNPLAQKTLTRLEKYFGPGLSVSIWQSSSITQFLSHSNFPDIALRGPTTLEHVIRTKRVPALANELDRYALDYQTYFDSHASRYPTPLTMLEPLPKVILDPEVGLVGVGRSQTEAETAAEIYRHTVKIILAAEKLGGYRSIDKKTAFDIEYWELEQARLKK